MNHKHYSQVEPAHYFRKEYDYKGRFCSYWHQIDEIISIRPSSILDIGIGNKFVLKYLMERRINITSLDIDLKLFPDLLGSVLFLPFIDNSFEVVSCCEVLEHLPYISFHKAISEIFKITEKYAIISLPDATSHLRLDIKVSGRIKINKLIGIPRIKSSVHQFDGEHYWEIGKYGYPLKKIQKDIQKTGFKIVKTYRVFEEPKHRFFILKK